VASSLDGGVIDEIIMGAPIMPVVCGFQALMAPLANGFLSLQNSMLDKSIPCPYTIGDN
jgi:hypothetical protein